MREFFQDFKSKFDEIAVEAGMSQEHYRQWLKKHRQADTVSSEWRYLIDLDLSEGKVWR